MTQWCLFLLPRSFRALHFRLILLFWSLKLAAWLWEAYSGIFLLLSSSCCVRRLMSQIQIICGVLIQVIMRQKEEKSMQWRAAPSHFLSFDMAETREGILQNISVFSHNIKKPRCENFFLFHYLSWSKYCKCECIRKRESDEWRDLYMYEKNICEREKGRVRVVRLSHSV